MNKVTTLNQFIIEQQQEYLRQQGVFLVCYIT